jgi:hypothetical protein
MTVGASLYNSPSGLYLTAEYNVAFGDNLAVGQDPESYFVKLGWRKNVNGLGETNFYGSYLNSQDLSVGLVEAEGYSLGAAQDLDAVGATLFMQGDFRSVDGFCGGLECEDLTTVVGGMKVTF